MKLPLEWVREYVDLDVDAAALAERLTASGSEVVGSEPAGRGWDRIVVGEIRAVSAHPDADRLTLCEVADGTGVRPIVCGAANCRAGDKVALALPGADFGQGMVIRERKVRGVLSTGMLCAEDELGLTADHSGILVLPPDAVVGRPLAAVLGEPAPVLDLDITWNRPDCLSILGMAREIAALLGTRLRRPAVTLAEDAAWRAADALRVMVADAAACPRYTGRVLAGLRVGPAPLWMRRRLHACGVRPINNLVDVTNYVMLECGQPLHAFDRRFLQGDTIAVRRARPDERIRTLDGVERRLREHVLVIADGTGPVALAGVMGGAGSEIRDDTADVVLESACFAAPIVRRASVELGLASESSRRFERGVDGEGAEWASRRAAQLMIATAGGRCAAGVVDTAPVAPPRRRVNLRYARIGTLLGVDVTGTEATGILAALELPAVAGDQDGCVIEVPGFRPDIEHEADLLEEVARIHGLDRVPAALPGSRQVSLVDDRRFRSLQRCREILVGMGLTETMNYSFLSERMLARFSGRGDWVRIPNPVSEDFAYLRDSLLPQMLETLARNWSRQIGQAALFEIGRTFHPAAGGQVRECERLALGFMGDVTGAGRAHARVGQDEAFLRAKGAVEALVRCTGAGTVNLSEGTAGWAEDGYFVALELGGRPLGCLGVLQAEIGRQWRMNNAVVLVELDVEVLLDGAFQTPAAKNVTVLPAVERDIALVAPASLRHARIVSVMRASAPPELTDIKLFDIFQSEGLGDGMRSMAYALTFRSEVKTLTDEEANAFCDRIKESLRKELEIEIREG